MSLKPIDDSPKAGSESASTTASPAPVNVCPHCGTPLSAAGRLRICLNCSFETAPSESEVLAVNTLNESETSDVKIPDKSETPTAKSLAGTNATRGLPPIWSPPPRSRGRATTRLGFGAGDPCPRMCGGLLEESDGMFACPTCSFRYPEPGVSEPGPNASEPSAPPFQEAETVSSLNGRSVTEPSILTEPEGRPESDDAPEPPPMDRDDGGPSVDALERQIELLKAENRRLLHLVYTLQQEVRRDPRAESEPSTADGRPRTTVETPPSLPWWRRLTPRDR